MNIVFKQFSNEHIGFSSTLNSAELEAELREYCSRSIWILSDTLSGRKKNNGWFRFTGKFKMSPDNGGGGNAIIVVRVLPAVDGCIVEARLRPHRAFIVIGLIVFAFGVLLVTSATPFNRGNAFKVLFVGLFLMIGIPGLLSYGCYYAKNALVQAFTQCFNVSKL
ncbi:MAG: hypothetical protein ABIN91_06805 [Mucilaginibacter sp.]|uniref:hypothetical protein n=1 Tax=Mucilaginibacter sp. TaxID=1882438 RepID=UPI0032676D8A